MHRRMLAIIAIFTLLLCACNNQAPTTQTDTAQNTDASENLTSNPTDGIGDDMSSVSEPIEVLAMDSITIRDVVPEYDTESDEMFIVPSVQEDGTSEAVYVHMGNIGHFEYADNVFTVCTDEAEMNQGTHFTAYVLEDGEFQKLDSVLFSQEYELYGGTYHVEFEYATYADQIIPTYSAVDAGTNFINGAVAFLSNMTCLVDFQELGTDGNTQHHLMILDLSDGELKDFYDGMNAELLDDLISKQVKAIAFLNETSFVVQQAGGTFYYVDIAQNRICNLETVIDADIKQCAFTSSGIVCWNADGDYWRVNTEDLQPRYLLNAGATSYSAGISQGNGSSFTVYKKDGQFHVFDFENEIDTTLLIPEGWELNTEALHSSPDGRKFYAIKRNDGEAIQILVFDCEQMKFIEIFRENLNDVSETIVGWTPDGKIVIASGEYTDFYIYNIPHMYMTY